MADYIERFYHTYCNPQGVPCRVSFQERDILPAVDIVRRGHFNSVAPSEIGIFKEGVDFSFLRIGDTVVISDSSGDDGTYTVTGFYNSAPPDDPYIRIQLSPQVPVTIEEDGVRVRIYQQGTEVEAAVYPFVKSLENSDQLKKGGIFPSTATVTFKGTDSFNMELLYTADETKYLIRHEVGGGLDWIGYVIPNGFFEDRHGENRDLVITASDRLPNLQNVLFTDMDGTNYGISDGIFSRSFIWAVKEALKKTGILLPIWTLVDVKPATSDDSRTIAVDVAFNVGLNTITLRDYTKTAKNYIASNIDILVNTGVRAGQRFTVQTYSVTTLMAYDVITINPVDALTGGNDTYSTSITTINQQPVAMQHDPLAITYHDVKTWINEADPIEGQNYFMQRQTAKTAWEVLDAIARQWNARICLNGDHWEVLRWNVMKIPDGEYQWFQYNSEGVQIGRTPYAGTYVMPCDNTEYEYEIFGSQIGMDRVLKGVNVNYRYKYKVEGDSLINLIRNGNLTPAYTPPDPPAKYTPKDWRRENSSDQNYMTLEYFPPLSPEGSPPVGIPFVRMGNVGVRFFYARYLSTESGYSMSVENGSRLSISLWYRGRWRNPGTIDPLVLRIFIRPHDSALPRSQLVNLGATGLGDINAATAAQLSSPIKLRSQWVDFSQHNDDALAFEVGRESKLTGGGTPDNQPAMWFNYLIETDPAPQAGNLVIEITGTGEPQLSTGYYTYSLYDLSGAYRNRQGRYSDRGGDIAGFFAAKIVNTSDESVPQLHGYTYPAAQTQFSRKYTDTIPDIEVLTGDDNDPDHVSNIYVNTGSGNLPVNQWDSWANEYGWSALGLVLAKSIMEQYWVPWRLISGTFAHEGINWSTRFMLEDRPGEVYAILWGQINTDTGQFTGTLVQVWDEGTPPLPPDGNDGGNSTNPQWTPSGVTTCVKDGSGLNTGDVAILERDTNPASLTYGQERWTTIGVDTVACPIGEPADILWGEQVVLDPDSLRFAPYEKNGDSYTVTYDGDDSAKLLRLLHRSSMGTVRSILYDGNYESISGWQYAADVVIGGYTYKHIYLTWPVGVFTDLPVIFVIN